MDIFANDSTVRIDESNTIIMVWWVLYRETHLKWTCFVVKPKKYHIIINMKRDSNHSRPLKIIEIEHKYLLISVIWPECLMVSYSVCGGEKKEKVVFKWMLINATRPVSISHTTENELKVCLLSCKALQVFPHSNRLDACHFIRLIVEMLWCRRWQKKGALWSVSRSVSFKIICNEFNGD